MRKTTLWQIYNGQRLTAGRTDASRTRRSLLIYLINEHNPSAQARVVEPGICATHAQPLAHYKVAPQKNCQNCFANFHQL